MILGALSLSARRAWIEIRRALGFVDPDKVALRKESVDRNREQFKYVVQCRKSLSARRAWIEMLASRLADMSNAVALRKESVDRNPCYLDNIEIIEASLSARRAWIEIIDDFEPSSTRKCRSPQGERG